MWVDSETQPQPLTYWIPGKDQVVAMSRVTVSAPTSDGDIKVIIHEVELQQLCSGVTYKYGIGDGGERELATATPMALWRFAVTSNPNAFAPGNAKVAWASITKHQPQFVVISGDISNKSTNADYLQFVTRGQPLLSQVPVYTAMGNHDNRTYTVYANWFNNETSDRENEAYYSVDIGPMRLVIINDMAARADMFPSGWFRETLKAAGDRWAAVVLNGNFRRFAYMQQQLESNKPNIDVIMTSGNNQFVDDGQLWVKNGGSEYIYHIVEMNDTMVQITRQVSTTKPKPPSNLKVEGVN